MVNVFKRMSSEGESDEAAAANNINKKKCRLIVQRCEAIQKENERLVHRIHRVKKILKRKQKERKFLMTRLDKYGDRWRNVSMPFDLQEPNLPTTKPSAPSVTSSSSSSHNHPSKSKPNSKTPSSSGEKSKKPNNKSCSSSSLSSQAQKKRPPSKVDKNAPKRPGNPYFQFCQEQRSIVIEEMASIGQPEPSKVEVTKHLANKWNTLTLDDKKIYYDMYERSKEKWNADMQLYSLSKGSGENN